MNWPQAVTQISDDPSHVRATTPFWWVGVSAPSLGDPCLGRHDRTNVNLPPRYDHLDDIAADLALDRVRHVRGHARLERRRYAPRTARRARELEDDRRLTGEVREHLLDPLEDRDGSLVIQRLAEANDELSGPAGG